MIAGAETTPPMIHAVRFSASLRSICYVFESNYKLLNFNSSTAKSTALAVNAMYKIEGLWLPVLVMQAPSVTNTFLQ